MMRRRGSDRLTFDHVVESARTFVCISGENGPRTSARLSNLSTPSTASSARAIGVSAAMTGRKFL